MATKLNKDITRETEIVIDGKPLLITLTSEQEILIKQKGSRKSKSVSIESLWGEEKKSLIPKKEIRKVEDEKNEPMVNLYWLRSQNVISTLDLKDTAKFDGIIKNLIDEFYKEKDKK